MRAEQQETLQPEDYLADVMCCSIGESVDASEDTGLGMEVDETQDENHNGGNESSQQVWRL